MLLKRSKKRAHKRQHISTYLHSISGNNSWSGNTLLADGSCTLAERRRRGGEGGGGDGEGEEEEVEDDKVEEEGE